MGKPLGLYRGMRCPHCGSDGGSRIVDTRDCTGKEARRRRHECDNCQQRYTTYEITAEQYDRLHLIEVDELQIDAAITALQAIKSDFGNGAIK